jgi:hypothetical protein
MKQWERQRLILEVVEGSEIDGSQEGFFGLGARRCPPLSVFKHFVCTYYGIVGMAATGVVLYVSCFSDYRSRDRCPDSLCGVALSFDLLLPGMVDRCRSVCLSLLSFACGYSFVPRRCTIPSFFEYFWRAAAESTECSRDELGLGSRC